MFLGNFLKDRGIVELQGIELRFVALRADDAGPGTVNLRDLAGVEGLGVGDHQGGEHLSVQSSTHNLLGANTARDSREEILHLKGWGVGERVTGAGEE
jgi:hypothetical protein